MNYDLVGIGNALVDIEVRVEDALVKQLNLRKGGMTLMTAEEQQRILDGLSGHSKKIASGGSAANTVHGFSVLGGSTYYLGRVANDVYGHHYTKDMNDCKVGFPGPGAETNGTGTCAILVTPDHERTMLTHLGISSSIHSDNVDESIVKNSRFVYIEGYLWMDDETRSAAKKMAAIAKQGGIPVAFTLSDAFVIEQHLETLIDFIRWNVDILFCNEAEGFALIKNPDPEICFAEMLGMAGTVFMTRGSHGAWAGNSDDGRVSVDAFPVNVVDTTGAGDLFAAGALYGLLKKRDLRESAIIGSYCAGQVVTHMGGRMPVHAHNDVKKILRSYNGA